MISEKFRKNLFRSLGILLGVLYFVLLLVHDAFEVNEFEEMERIVPDAAARIWITVLRALTAGSVMTAIFSCFFSFPSLSASVRYFSPAVSALNVAFYRLNFTCYLGNEYTTGLLAIRIVGFVLENLLIFAISLLNWLEFVKKGGGKPSAKSALLTAGFIAFVTVFAAPTTTLMSLNGGIFGYNSREFNLFHVIVLLICVALPVVLTLLFRNKPYEIRYFICCYFSVALLFGFFSRYDFASYKDLFAQLIRHEIPDGMDALPFQLCNLGIVLSGIAYAFKSKTVFYFNFLGNFVGFLMGLLLPKISGDFFRPTTVHYWQNHIYGILLIILGLSLRIFAKPTKKDLKNALLLFLGYFVFVMILDVWFGYDYDQGKGCNFFFLNSSLYADYLHIGLIREAPFVIRWTDAAGFTYRIYYLYWIVIYVVYSLLMTAVYFGTSLICKAADKIRFSKGKKNEEV